MNTAMIRDRWGLFKGKLKEKYATLTDNDLAYILGREEEMLGHIQEKTGASRAELEQYLYEARPATG